MEEQEKLVKSAEILYKYNKEKASKLWYEYRNYLGINHNFPLSVPYYYTHPNENRIFTQLKLTYY